MPSTKSEITTAPVSDFAAFKDLYYAELGRRVRRSMTEKAKMGFLPNRSPIGYRNTQEGTIAIDKQYAPTIQKLFTLAATGNYSLRELLKQSIELGLVSRGGRRLGVSALWKVLTNPFYTGLLRYGGEIIQGNHEPLITQELFDQVQAQLASRRKRHKK